MSKKISARIIAIVLTLSLAMPVNVLAASNGTNNSKVGFETVSSNARAVKNGWTKVSGKWFYYKAGKLATGWQKIGGKTYYFKKVGANGVKGRMLSGWQIINKQTYYFGGAEDGALKTGWHKLNNKWFFFKRVGVNGILGKMLVGWQKIDGKTYYFKKVGDKGAKGRMLSGWNKINNQIYNFGGTNDGAMKLNWQKINNKNFYFQPNGAKGVQGKMLTGWQTISSKKYYLKPSGAMGTMGERLQNGTYTIDGKSYYFNASGVQTTAPSPSYPQSGYIEMKDPTDGRVYKVEPEIKTDPQIGSKNISEEAFFAAVLYTESGDQGYIGQLMVGMTILNRTVHSDPYWPDSLKFVVYQDGNYAVARSNDGGKTPGALTKTLKEIQSQGYTAWKSNKYHKDSVQAAKDALKMIDAWKKDKKNNRRTINKEITNLIKAANKKYGIANNADTIEFNHTYFVTPEAFARLGKNPKSCQMFNYRPNPKNSGHNFFRNWN